MTKTYDQYLDQFDNLKELIESPDTPTKVAANALVTFGMLVGGAKFNQTLRQVDQDQQTTFIVDALQYVLKKSLALPDIHEGATSTAFVGTKTKDLTETLSALDSAHLLQVQNSLMPDVYKKHILCKNVDTIYEGLKADKQFQSVSYHFDILQFNNVLLVRPPYAPERWDVYSQYDSQIGGESIYSVQIKNNKQRCDKKILQQFQSNQYPNIGLFGHDHLTCTVATHTGFQEVLKQQDKDPQSKKLALTQNGVRKLGADKLLAPKR